MKTYPSLYAALEPDTDAQGRRVSVVRCTATRHALGHVWWEAIGGTTVVWHYRTDDAQRGQRTTERNAVQALRDIANGQLAHPLPAADVEDAPSTTTRPRPVETARRAPESSQRAPVAPAPHRQQIVWGNASDIATLRTRIADALARQK